MAWFSADIIPHVVYVYERNADIHPSININVETWFTAESKEFWSFKFKEFIMLPNKSERQGGTHPHKIPSNADVHVRIMSERVANRNNWRNGTGSMNLFLLIDATDDFRDGFRTILRLVILASDSFSSMLSFICTVYLRLVTVTGTLWIDEVVLFYKSKIDTARPVPC